MKLTTNFPLALTVERRILEFDAEIGWLLIDLYLQSMSMIQNYIINKIKSINKKTAESTQCVQNLFSFKLWFFICYISNTLEYNRNRVGCLNCKIIQTIISFMLKKKFGHNLLFVLKLLPMIRSTRKLAPIGFPLPWAQMSEPWFQCQNEVPCFDLKIECSYVI